DGLPFPPSRAHRPFRLSSDAGRGLISRPAQGSTERSKEGRMDPRNLLGESVFDRRDWLRYATLLGAGAVGAAFGGGASAPASASDSSASFASINQEQGDASNGGVSPSASRPLARSPKRYDMKKSINTWAFPYPSLMSLREVLELAKRAGFDAVEINYSLDDDLSPNATEKELHAIRAEAERIGIEISGLCSFLFWPFPFSANSEATRARAIELATHMIEVAHHLGTENLLVVPGAVYVPWREDSEAIPYDVCDRRAREAIRKLLPIAERHRVHLNLENIFFNGYL